MQFRRLTHTLKQTGADFIADDCMGSGAAIGYYTIFSLPPLLAIVFAAATQFWSPDQVTRVINEQLGLPVQASSADEDVASGDSYLDLTSMAERARKVEQSKHAWWTRILGIGILIFSASGVLSQLQAALNKAWNVEPHPEAGELELFIRKRLLSLGMVIVFGLLLLISLVLTSFVDEFTSWLEGGIASSGVYAVVMILNNLLTLAMASLLFAATFKVLPDAKIDWRDVFIGAGVTAVLFVIGKNCISWYLQISEAGSSWGSAAASMVGILIWVYYSSLIILLGAEFTQNWAIDLGSGLKPADGAVLVTESKHYHHSEAEVVHDKSELHI